MVKKSKLLGALDAHKGRNYRLEKQRKQEKESTKRKQKQSNDTFDGFRSHEPDARAPNALTNGASREEDPPLASNSPLFGDGEGWETGGSEQAELEALDASRLDDSDSDSSLEQELAMEGPILHANGNLEPNPNPGLDNGGISLSDIEDLSEDEKAHLVPHQRLTINNTSALLKAHKSIAIATSKLPFSNHQTILSSEEIPIPDINDDLNRELAFYKQCLNSVKEARSLLNKEGVAFTRPADYFAEMVKSDEHMGKIKQKMTDEAARKKAASESRRQRDLKKFGKQVQVAKLQERDRAKKDTLEKINILKRKRKNADTGNAREDDLFDVALEDASRPERPARRGDKDRRAGQPNKRQKKDEKFGFGGKKRFAKSGDAVSSGDMRSFSTSKMKGQKTGTRRLGKSKRAKKA